MMKTMMITIPIPITKPIANLGPVISLRTIVIIKIMSIAYDDHSDDERYQ